MKLEDLEYTEKWVDYGRSRVTGNIWKQGFKLK